MTTRIPHFRKLLVVAAAVLLVIAWLVFERASDRNRDAPKTVKTTRSAKVPVVPKGFRPKRPNIVVIQTDDQIRATFAGRYRDPSDELRQIMPQMTQGVLNQGAELRNYYVSNPVCSPSRATLLTGQYSTNNGLKRNNGPHGGWAGWQSLPTWTNNVPLTLQRAGYRTAHFGKLMNGYWDSSNDGVNLTIPPGWDRWATTAYIARANYYGFRLSDDGRAVGPFGTEDYQLKRPVSDSVGVDPPECRVFTISVDRRRCNYQTDVLTRRAEREIWRNARHHQKPFYLQIDYEAPHGDKAKPSGPTPPTRYAWSARRATLPTSPAFDEADTSDKPKLIQNAAKKRLTQFEKDRLTRIYQRSVETVRGVDDGVGTILRALRQTGQLDHTYVFYLSDQGEFLGEQRFQRGKFLAYDASTRVGVAVRGPGIKPGTKVDEIVGNTDIPATVLDLAGAKPRYAVDGRPLQPFWRSPEMRTRRPFQLAYFGGSEGGASAVIVDGREVDSTSRPVHTSGRAPAVSHIGYRIGPYKFTQYKNGEREIYDLRNDPYELENRIGDPRYAAVERYLVGHLRQVMRCSGQSCSRWLPAWPQPQD